MDKKESVRPVPPSVQTREELTGKSQMDGWVNSNDPHEGSLHSLLDELAASLACD
jgi:hypothetical protein